MTGIIKEKSDSNQDIEQSQKNIEGTQASENSSSDDTGEEIDTEGLDFDKESEKLDNQTSSLKVSKPSLVDENISNDEVSNEIDNSFKQPLKSVENDAEAMSTDDTETCNEKKDEEKVKESSDNTCEITLDLSDEEDTLAVKENEPSEEELQEKARKLEERAQRKQLLLEMEETKYDYQDMSIEIKEDPEFDTEDEDVKESDNFKRYWSTVADAPQDFSSWTYLLQLVDSEPMSLKRRSYNSFFKRYPLCYGYWKRFSELERKEDNLHRSQKILERGVRAIPLSVDLWIHVTDFYIKYYKGPDAGEDKVRSVFNRAIKAAGDEFKSEKLWKKYINYEVENKQYAAALEIYDQVLAKRTYHYKNFTVEFEEFVMAQNPETLLKENEFTTALNKARENLSKSVEKTDSQENSEEDLDEAPPGVEDHEKPPNEEELNFILKEIVQKRKDIIAKTEQEVTKIWKFEEGIKRPYFHVKQLERAQLKNWREYLDHEIANSDHQNIVLLFERCLIACALYEDFWLKYARYMEEHDVEKARRIYQRACCIHLPNRSQIHVQWATFEEIAGNSEKATEILEKLIEAVPNMAYIKMKRVNCARRAGNLDVAEKMLREYVSSSIKPHEEKFYTRKLVWFLYKMVGKKEEACKIQEDLIAKHTAEVKLCNDLVEMQLHSGSKGMTKAEEETALKTFNFILDKDLTEDQKFSFSQKKLEFLEDFGSDVKAIRKTYDEHQKLVKQQKKRQAEASAITDQPPSKKSKSASYQSGAPTTLANGARLSTTPVMSYAQGQYQQQYASGDPAAAQYYQQWNNYQQQQGRTAGSNYYSQWPGQQQYYGSR